MRIRSKSEIQAFRRCRREHFFAYELRRRPLFKADALRIGTAFDEGLAVWWTTLDVGAAIAKASSLSADAFEAEKLAAMLRGYDARWRTSSFDVLAVQKSFLTPVSGTGEVFGGRFDAIVRTAEGRIAGIESKSSSEDIDPGSWFWTRTRLDIQISHYLDGAKSIGFDMSEIIYDVSRKPKLDPYKKVAVVKMTKATAKEPSRPYANQRLEDETPEEYGKRCVAAISEAPESFYQRATIVRLDDEARAASKDLEETVGEMIDATQLRRRPRNPDACQRYGSLCPYFAVCTGAGRIEDDTLFRTEAASHVGGKT